MSAFLPKFVLAAVVGLSAVGGAQAVVVPKIQTQHIAQQLGEQHLHAALKATHASAQAEKSKNGQVALSAAQAAIKELHAAAHAFDQHHKATGHKTGHHPSHPHIQAAIHDIQVAEKLFSVGNIGKSEKDLHKASVQIQDAIKAHALHHKK